MTRPSFENIYMRLALMMAERSTCKRLKVGCVITSTDFRYVYGVGYNGNATGLNNSCDSEEVGKCGCFVEGTGVYPSGATMAYRRRYVGDIIRVVTKAGEFSVTPNHPVLAAGSGWRAAELLQKGDYLLGAVRDEDMTTRAPHYNQALRIEEVFESFAVAGSVVRHAGARHQFHGDGIIDEDVDVVARDGGLRTYLEGGVDQHGNNIPDRKVDHALTFVPAEVLGNLAKDPSFSQSVLNCRVSDTKVLCDVANALTIPVTAYEVLHVERNWWSGHVFNLSTLQNWYNLQVGGIIAHNCLHAEENAVINCTVSRDVPKVVFTTNLPCSMCVKRLINLGGVQALYYNKDYRDHSGIDLLIQAGIRFCHWEL